MIIRLLVYLYVSESRGILIISGYISDKPVEAGIPVKGPQGCTSTCYSISHAKQKKTGPMTPIDQAMDEDGGLLTDILACHDGAQAAQALEFKKYKRRRG